MALGLPIVVAIGLGLALGGRLGSLARLEFRASWLFFAAIALQLVAFPLSFVPWDMSETGSSVLWLVSYALLVVAAVLNVRIAGVPIVAAGMLLNLVAVLVNRGTMPVSASAMRAAGDSYTTQANSTAMTDPSASWLIDRWAAPEWIPFANVFSVGDVVITVGAVVIVLAGMGVHVSRIPARSDASV